MKNTRLTLLHPTGNSNVRALAEGVEKMGLLQNFFTCIALFTNSAFYSFTGVGPLKEFRKRIFSNNLKPYTKVRPFNELGRLLSKRLGGNAIFNVEKVYYDLDKYAAGKLKNCNAVYAFEDGALKTFEQAKSQQMTCYYDLPIGYWRSMHKILDEERRKKPEWAETLQNFKDSREKLNRKDKELELADQIFVASTFTAHTLEEFPQELAPVKIIPYGFPEITNKKIYPKKFRLPLKVLFVGGLSQRKGISYLFEAQDILKDEIELTVVGHKSTEKCEVLNKSLKQCNWISSLPHPKILDLMRNHDVLVFPSLFEGFGMVITEAMSQGTPVITTNRTCGQDIITHGENGWLIETGSSTALVNQLQEIIEKPSLIEKNGRAAIQTAEQRPWSKYGTEMAETLSRINN